MAHRYPDSAVLYRGLDRAFPRIVRGRGAWLYDETGKDYLDASGGAYAASLGHGVAEIAAAVAAQMERVAFVSGTAFTNDAVEELAAELLPLGIGDLDKHYFLTSGSDAVEAALKLARQYWVEAGRATKHKIIALEPGYHGNTILALSASARPRYQRLYGDWLVPVTRIPAPYPYRCGCEGAANCPRCSGALLEEAILREGADTVAAFIGETVGGSSTGASVPRPEYWRTIREICDRHGVLWIADEVLVGSGRTGTWTAVEQYGAVPDLLTLGKGISGGYAPLAAVVAPRRLLDPIARGSGAVSHAQTFSHTPVACAAGLAAVRYLKANGLLERCRAMGERLHDRLAALRDHPLVGDVRGRGMLAGIELVADRRTRAPFPRSLGIAERLTGICREEGLVIWPNVGQVDGTDGDLICLAPPFVLTDDDLGALMTRLTRALDRTEETMTAPDGADSRVP